MKSRTITWVLAGISFLFLSAQSVCPAVFRIPDGDVAALKNAIKISNSNSEDDTVELAAGATYTLTAADNVKSGPNGLPVIEADNGRSLTIQGNASTIRRSTSDGTPPFRIFYLGNAAKVTISGLMIMNGDLLNAAGSDSFAHSGAAIYNQATLALNNCILKGNAADFGGGIFNDGIHCGAVLTINSSGFNSNTAVSGGGAIYSTSQSPGNATITLDNCIFAGNSADHGGALVNDNYSGNAIITVTNCTLSGNWAEVMGGAIENARGSGNATINLSSSTLIGNIVDPSGLKGGDGGAIYNRGNFGVTNSTLSGNSATNAGGAIYNRNNLTITGSTFSSNSGVPKGAGGAIYNGGNLVLTSSTLSENEGVGIFNNGLSKASLIIGNTILKSGSRGGNLYNYFHGTITSTGYNLSDDDGGGFLRFIGDQIRTNPMLHSDRLQNNGGPTRTISLLPGSPAIHKGDPSAPARDQRYYLRNRAPDIGALENGGILTPIRVVSRKAHGAVGTFDIDLPLSGPAGIECRSGGENGDHQIVITFASPVTIADARITKGSGSVSDFAVSRSQATVNLTGITNAQEIAVTLSGVTDGANTNDVRIPMRILLGNVTGTGIVRPADAVATQLRIGQPITEINFRSDVTLAGTIDEADLALVKSQAGTSISALTPESEAINGSEEN